MKTTILLFFLACNAYAESVATTQCSVRTSISTSVGLLVRENCETLGAGGTARTNWRLDNQLLVSGPHPITVESINKTKSLFLLEGASDPITGCPQLFLLDFTGQRPSVFTFGVKNACNEFHWANWGKKRSVIAIKKNVKFVYENGKLTPPKKDNDLFLTIKPTMFETPVEKLDPFVEELSIK